MKINEFNVAQIQKMYQQQKNKGLKDNNSHKADRMNISRQAQEMKQIKLNLKDINEVREEKVRKIKEAVKNGTYQIEAKKIAEKILSDINQG